MENLWGSMNNFDMAAMRRAKRARRKGIGKQLSDSAFDAEFTNFIKLQEKLRNQRKNSTTITQNSETTDKTADKTAAEAVAKIDEQQLTDATITEAVAAFEAETTPVAKSRTRKTKTTEIAE